MLDCTPAGFERYFDRLQAELTGHAPPPEAAGPFPETIVVGPQIGSAAMSAAAHPGGGGCGSPDARKAVLTTHIASAVALLGTTAGLTIMGIRTAGTDDFRQAHAVYDVMSLLTFSLGIPLSFIALASGVLLATTSKWGLFGYWWVTTKLALLVGVIVIGATVTGASIDTMLDVTERGARHERRALDARHRRGHPGRDGARGERPLGLPARWADPHQARTGLKRDDLRQDQAGPAGNSNSSSDEGSISML